MPNILNVTKQLGYNNSVPVPELKLIKLMGKTDGKS